MSTTIPTAFARRGCDGLAQIGPTRFDIAGIRFVEGEGAAGGDGQQKPADEQKPASTPPWGDDPSKFDPDKAWKLIENLRSDAEKRQEKTDAAIAAAAEKAQKDTLAQFAKLLTGEQAPETDPVKLNDALTKLQTQSTETASKLTAAEQQVKAGQVALQVAILGGPLGANVPLLLTNEQFKTAIASIEPTDQAAITAEITKALQANAALKQPPARSGAGDHTGPTVASLEAQLKAAEEKKDFTETIRLKRAIAAAKTAQTA